MEIQRLRKSLVFVVALFALLSAWCAVNAESERPWLIYNEDNDHYFKGPSALMTKFALEDYIDYVCRGQVTHFFMCPSGQRASFDSKTREPIWAGIGEPNTEGQTNDIWCVNAKLLHDRGIDPYAVWSARCRKHGVSPWVSMRMNDVHFANISNYFRTTGFVRARRDLWLNPDGSCADWNDMALDYAQKEVRDYNLAHLRELAERWDVDGVELDWMRFGRHLKRGRERADAHFLDEFVRDARQALDEVGAKRGKRISLGVRICRDPDLAISKMGMDVAMWARLGWVDLVVPHSFYLVDTEISVEKWITCIRAANPSVKVIPGIDNVVRTNGGERRMTAAMYRWVAAKFAQEGAKGIYLFNLPYGSKYQPDGKPIAVDVADAILTEGLSPSTVMKLQREEVVPYHDF